MNNFSLNLAKQYFEANWQALKKYEEIIQTNNIDCDFTKCPSFLYAITDKELIVGEFNAAQQIGIKAYLTTETELPFPVATALCFEEQANFNPLKFLYSLANKLNIFEHSRVISVDNNKIVTTNGSITADKIVFVCHYPFINMPGYYFARMHQEKSYVLACLLYTSRCV